MSQEFLRSFIIGIGWSALFVTSIYTLVKSIQFYRKTRGSPFGKLVLASIAGWLITMYSLGIVSTFYLISDISSLRIIFPVFLVWFVTLVIILSVTIRWSKEAATLHASYIGLEAEIKRRTQDLERAHRKELENQKQIQRLQDEFLFIAAHELRSPVNAIKWGLQTILEDYTLTANFSSETKEILNTTYERNEQLRDLIGRLLNTARLEQGVLTIRTEQVSPAEIIYKVLQESRHTAMEHDVRFHNEAQHAPLVVADPLLLKEILTNLITNAIRYNKEKGSITISYVSTSKMVTIRVTDTGKGIPSNQLKHLFEKFYHIKHGVPMGEDKSVGLGLYITKELVIRMGGTIRAESTLGKGSSFIFTLPRA